MGSEQNPYSGELAERERALSVLPTLRFCNIALSTINTAAVLTLQQICVDRPLLFQLTPITHSDKPQLIMLDPAVPGPTRRRSKTLPSTTSYATSCTTPNITSLTLSWTSHLSDKLTNDPIPQPPKPTGLTNPDPCPRSGQNLRYLTNYTLDTADAESLMWQARIHGPRRRVHRAISRSS